MRHSEFHTHGKELLAEKRRRRLWFNKSVTLYTHAPLNLFLQNSDYGVCVTDCFLLFCR
jgi:hypothetical protein